MNLPRLFCALLMAVLASACASPDNSVNLYSARKEALIKPLLDAFTKQTGITVNVISSKADALLKRIESEGVNSPADVLLTTDVGRLYRAKTAGVLQPINSAQLNAAIPSQYRDSEQYWFGLSLRARTVMVSDDSQPTSFAELAEPAYQGKICVRSSSNIYNQSLVAAMLEHQGAQDTERWAKALVNNFARPPQGGDRDQIRAAAAGQCSVVIANTYYLAQMLASSQDYQAASAVRVLWLDQDQYGTHVNISGAGVVKNAPNKDHGVRLIEFLSSAQAQAIYANVNYEYPVIAGVEVNDILRSWGDFKADSLALKVIGENNAQAVKLMDRAGWR